MKAVLTLLAASLAAIVVIVLILAATKPDTVHVERSLVMKGTPAEGTVRAKTGTMSNVRALAGYAVTRDGEHLAFVAIVNNFEGTGAQANDALDTIAAHWDGATHPPKPATSRMKRSKKTWCLASSTTWVVRKIVCS